MNNAKMEFKKLLNTVLGDAYCSVCGDGLNPEREFDQWSLVASEQKILSHKISCQTCNTTWLGIFEIKRSFVPINVVFIETAGLVDANGVETDGDWDTWLHYECFTASDDVGDDTDTYHWTADYDQYNKIDMELKLIDAYSGKNL